LTQFRRGNADNYPGARTGSEADQRVAPAVALASRGDPQNVLPREGMFARRQAQHERVITHRLQLASIRLGVVQHYLDFPARRQLPEAFPIGLGGL
jgi:hypothetical protein